MDFALTLLNWFRENGRELPWRQTRDPYAVWLSEIILQQTQVKQGWAYWERFMRRWPTVQDLAAATEDEVLREWQGLGYYSRARNLHTAAKQVVAMGGFPTTIEGLRQLKGVGDYTAAAIGSIAFGLPAAVVDGNVYRVLARHFGISTPINTTEGKKEFAMLAQSLLPENNSQCSMFHVPCSMFNVQCPTAAYNQAIMDFGATQCTPANPQCLQCPLQDSCIAFREGRVAQLPVKQRTLKVKERHLSYIYVRCHGETAIRRRPAGDIWQGLYEPLLIDNGQLTMDNWVAQHNYQLSILNCQLLCKNLKHVLTHRILYADFWLWEPDERPSLPEGYFWIPESDLDRYAVPRLIEILLESLNS
jgi:A/G-specific adenine glycosylase